MSGRWQRALALPLATLLLPGHQRGADGFQGRNPVPLDVARSLVEDAIDFDSRIHSPRDDEALDDQTALYQSLVGVDHRNRTAAARGAVGAQGHGFSNATVAVGKDVQDSFLEALRLESVRLFEQMRALEEQSATSATAVAELASASANRTQRLVQELAADSLVVMAQIEEAQKHSARPGGRTLGPAYAYPQAHVAERLARAPEVSPAKPPAGEPGPSPRGGRAAADSGAARGAAEAHIDHALSLAPKSMEGSLRLTMTLLGTGIVAASFILMANRKSVASSLQKRLKHGDGPPSEASGDAAPPHTPTCGTSSRLSVWDGTVATFSCLIGTGLLAMPYAFSLAGLIGAPVVIFFVYCSAYTADLMASCLNASGSFSLAALVEAAFGRRAKGAINTFLIVELWGYVLSSLLCTSLNVAQMIDGLEVSSAIGVSALAAYSLSFVPARMLTRVNVVSNVVFIACCAMFLLTGLLLPSKAPASDIALVKPRGLLSAAGILVFSPAGHSFYPALMERMEEPAKFPVCVRRAYATACVVYLAVAIPGYCLFGNSAQPSAVRNIGVDLSLAPLPDLGWMNSFAAIGMAVKMLSLTVLCLAPLVHTIRGVLAERAEVDAALVELAVTPCLLLVSAAVALRFADEMAMLLNLVGSVFCMNVAFVVPVLCYWKLSREPLSGSRRLGFAGLIAMGLSLAVLGVLSAL